jgi:hypothetical protein
LREERNYVIGEVLHSVLRRRYGLIYCNRVLMKERNCIIGEVLDWF